jgi:uncharacterized lipoprotein YddW (UPF0748 family)
LRNHQPAQHRVTLNSFSLFFALACSCVLQAENYIPSRATPPPVAREMRAVWVATVANIDWPSTNTLSTAQQKAELINILNRASELKLNTIIFQVRPACDALYASSLEPWSEYLTGAMGKPPSPFYDPLAFAIEEAHKRGLELHAWFNPYRARQAAAKSPVASGHISKTHPEFVRLYGKSLWLDPGDKAAQAYSLSVVIDVLKRYDVDGIHFDDYFYPYKEPNASGGELDFPDDSSWRRFGAGGNLSREDWRRENVNGFVRRVYESIKATKPWVKFGISPFGIWRPGNPPQIQGLDPYATIYADSRQWLARGWLDYLSPQLYWAINAPAQSFPVLLKWWSAQNAKGRIIAPGMDDTKVGHDWSSSEIVNQVRITRTTAGVSGHVHWNMKALMREHSLDEALQRDLYQRPALPPAVPGIDPESPERPTLTATRVPRRITWKPAPKDEIRLWVLQTRHGGEWTSQIFAAKERTFPLAKARPDVIALTAIDKYGNASPPASLELDNSPQ